MRQTEEANSTRERILETALHLFSREGFLGATTREIAREAGIAEVTLFRHFSSKERLFEEVVNTFSFLPALKGLLPEIKEMPYQEALGVIARRFLETLTLRKDLITIMQREMQRYPEKVREVHHAFIDEIFKIIASYFREMQRRGVLREFDTAFAARAFLGMFFSYFNAEEILLWKRYRHIDTDATIREFVDIFARGTMKGACDERQS
ncbi:MAG: TetR/AcrR family transcriptional regulator [Alphaproteobacteria bacterium]|uniref:TetR/AcrR family transcriptional regulator n=1 Tax=Candidatus Nitrobium versatile TaxID=2884831 RepID=A0A953J6H5_9BACT|nr:TetR/AcrR family transcriptional regulator [Candidatus Nitrobium versatile]